MVIEEVKFIIGLFG